MLIENNKPIKVIGYPESSMTRDYIKFTSKQTKNKIDIINPEKFFNSNDCEKYQYFIGFSLDMKLREKVCDKIDKFNLDCVSYIDDTSIIFDDAEIGKGIFIGPFTTIQNSIVSDYASIECYCLVSHDVKLGRNCVVHPGTLIAGKTKIGNNCTFGFKSSVINKVSITDNVNLRAFSNITKNIEIPGNYVGTIARYREN